MGRIAWYFKQLLPLKYDTIYQMDGQWYIVVWRMWFGQCFHEKHYKLAEGEIELDDQQCVLEEIRDGKWVNDIRPGMLVI